MSEGELSKEFWKGTSEAAKSGYKQFKQAFTDPLQTEEGKPARGNTSSAASFWTDVDIAKPISKAFLGGSTALLSPIISAFNMGTQTIKETADRTLPAPAAKIVGEAIPALFTLVHKTSDALGVKSEYEKEGKTYAADQLEKKAEQSKVPFDDYLLDNGYTVKETTLELLKNVGDMIVGGKALHVAGKLGKGALEIGGKTIKDVKDIKAALDKASNGELPENELSDLQEVVEEIKKTSFSEVKKYAEEHGTTEVKDLVSKTEELQNPEVSPELTVVNKQLEDLSKENQTETVVKAQKELAKQKEDLLHNESDNVIADGAKETAVTNLSDRLAELEDAQNKAVTETGKASYEQEIKAVKGQIETLKPKEENTESLPTEYLEKRWNEISDKNVPFDSPEASEFNRIEKELEKRERDSVFKVPLGGALKSLDRLAERHKNYKTEGEPFADKRDIRESKEVIEKYLAPQELADSEIKKDFVDALRGNPTTWYADGLKLRESANEAAKRGIEMRELIQKAKDVYLKEGYDESTANSVVAGFLQPILKGASEIKNANQDVLKPKKREITGYNSEGTEKGTGGDIYLASQEAAEALGGEVSKYKVEVENPYVVKMDSDFDLVNSIMKKYEAEHPKAKWHPEVTTHINKELKKLGYDALIIEETALETEKGYTEIGGSYGSPQSIIFDRTKAELQTPTPETLKEGEQLNPQQNATENRSLEESNLEQHQNGNESGKKTTPSSSDRNVESGQIEKEVLNAASEEPGLTGITHEQTNKIAKELGQELYEPKPEEQEDWLAEAKERLQKDPEALAKLVSKLESGNMPTAVEQKMLGLHIASINARLRENITDAGIAEFNKFKKLYDIEAGRAVGKSLAARKGELPIEDTLGGMLTEMIEATGQEKLTEVQKAEVNKSFAEIEASKLAAEAKVKKLEAELNKYKADQKFKNEIDDVRKNRRKVTKEKLDSEFENLQKEFQLLTRGSANLNISPQAVAVIGKMFRNRVEKGAVNLQEVIDDIYDKVKEAKISKEDIRDIIAGKHSEKKQTLNDITSKIRDFKSEADYINKLEALMRGEEPKTEIKKRERSQEIKALQDKIREFKKESGLGVKTALKSAKTRNENALKALEEKIKNKDYTTKKVVSALDSELAKNKFPDLRNEALDALKRKEDARHQWHIDKAKAEMANYSKVQKLYEGSKKITTTLRAVKAGIDDSFTMIQGGLAMMANPQSGAKAFREHFKDAMSEKRFERELTALHNSPNWELIQNSKLDIFEPKTIKEREREGILDYNLLNESFKIKGKEFNVGKYTTRPFERAFISMGNNLRMNVFMRKAEQLFQEGKTFETHPQEFKDLAEVVNTMTGRGTLHPLADNKLVNSVVWSPRLLASGFNLLGLGDVANPITRGQKGYYAKLTPEMRKYAISQTVKGIGLGVAIMLAAKAGGADVDMDPTSVTFGNIKPTKDGNSYNVFGRFTPIVRLVAVSATGKKTFTGGGTKKTDAGKEGLRFMRGKLTPLMGTLVDVVTGKTYMWDEVTVSGELHNMIDPLSLTDIIKGVKQDGSISILDKAIPAFEGIKVTNEKDFSQKTEREKKMDARREKLNETPGERIEKHREEQQKKLDKLRGR